MGSRTEARPPAPEGQWGQLKALLHRSGPRVAAPEADGSVVLEKAREIVEAYLHPEEVAYALASMPGRTPEPWTAEEQRFWAATVVPAAEEHAALATQLAAKCGTRTAQERTVAATHILMTLTLGSPSVPSHQVRPAILHSAYDVLESALPEPVREVMPVRLVATRGLAGPHARRLLAALLLAAAAGGGFAEVKLVQALLG